MTKAVLVTRCDWSGKKPERHMWSAMEPGIAQCACSGTWRVVLPFQPVAFPEHGRGQCFPGHCEAWPTDLAVEFDQQDVLARLWGKRVADLPDGTITGELIEDR